MYMYKVVHLMSLGDCTCAIYLINLTGSTHLCADRCRMAREICSSFTSGMPLL